MKTVNIFAFVSLAIVAAGCSAFDRYGYREDAISSPGYSTVYSPAEIQRRADQDLVVAVRNEFDRYGNLNGVTSNVDVSAHNGTVTLSGVVPTRRDREVVDAVVRNTHGVSSVNNLLQAGDSWPTPTSRSDDSRIYRNAGENFNLHVQGLSETDRDLAQQILNGLRADPTMNSQFANVDIYVSNGRVTLQGMVESEQQRRMIHSAVERAAGMNVRNQLQVQRNIR